jgi:hypothetical protein
MPQECGRRCRAGGPKTAGAPRRRAQQGREACPYSLVWVPLRPGTQQAYCARDGYSKDRGRREACRHPRSCRVPLRPRTQQAVLRTRRLEQGSGEDGRLAAPSLMSMPLRPRMQQAVPRRRRPQARTKGMAGACPRQAHKFPPAPEVPGARGVRGVWGMAKQRSVTTRLTSPTAPMASPPSASAPNGSWRSMG